MEELFFNMRVFLVVFAAQTLFLWVYGISDNFSSLGDFFKTLKDREYNYLSYVFRKGKHLRFVSDFPADLRKACLGKKSFYLETEKDLKPTNKKRQEAKRLVRAVLTNDDLINEYFKGTYFTYEDYVLLKDAIGYVGVDAKMNLLTILESKLKYENTAEAIFNIIINVMTDNNSDLPGGKREAALYYALTMSDCINMWTQKDFVDFVKMMAMVNPEVRGFVGPSTICTYLNPSENPDVMQYSGLVQVKIRSAIAPYIAKS